VERMDVGESHAALQLGGLHKLRHYVRLPAHEQISIGMPGDWCLEDALGGTPEFEAAPRQLDFQGRAELLAHAAEGAAGGSAAQLVRLEEEDVGLAFRREVVGDRAAGYAPADDRRPHSLCRHANLREVPTIGGFSKRREGSRCSRSKARRRWSRAADAASAAPSRSRSRDRERMWRWRPGAATSSTLSPVRSGPSAARPSFR